MDRGERLSRASPDVSPLSATSSPITSQAPALTSSGSRRYSSNLPLPKSNTKKFWKLPNTAKGFEGLDSTTVRWDEYSGEPTGGDRGKPPSATPGSIKLRETPSPLSLRPNFGTSTIITSNNCPARKRVGNRDVAEAPIMIRPEWKGAGGRHSIVKPLFDKPLRPGQTGKFPAGSQKQWEEQERARTEVKRAAQEQEQREMKRSEQERLANEHDAAEAAKQTNDRAAQEQREREREQQQRMARVRIEKAKRERERILHAQEETERRAKERVERIPQPSMTEPLRETLQSSSPPCINTPDKVSATSEPSLGPPEPQQPHSSIIDESDTTPEPHSQLIHNPRIRLGNLVAEDMRSPLARNPSHDELRRRRDQSLPSLPQSQESSPSSPPATGRPLRDTTLSEVPERTSSLQDSCQIEARFRSKLQTLALEDQPRSRFSATTVATTIYDNSPPQTPEMSSERSTLTNTPTSILNRKRPVAPSGIIRRKPTPSQAGTPNGMINTDDMKSLPKPPPDAEVVDPIRALQAKVDVLRRRRKNLETLIHELTHVVQPSSIAYDRTSRAEVKKTVAVLDKELSEVIKDEHETGLKLHRAWKRHEDFAPYEPTSIWVRRVTN